MNCLIGLSLTLIAIVAGMLLLAQTQKENLGNIYKAIAYFVIITAFLGFLAGVCCGLCQLAHCGKEGGCPPMEKHQMMMNRCMGGGESGCRMMGHGGMGCGMGMGCEMGMEKKCKKMCSKKQMMGWDGEDDEMEDVNVEIIHKKVEKEVKPEEPAKK